MDKPIKKRRKVDKEILILIPTAQCEACWDRFMLDKLITFRKRNFFEGRFRYTDGYICTSCGHLCSLSSPIINPQFRVSLV